MFQVHLFELFFSLPSSSIEKLFLDERKADYPNRFQKNIIFDDESLLSDQQSMVFFEETSSINQDNYSTTSGRTSSTISSVQVDDFFEMIESADVLEEFSSKTATHAKAYLINSTESSTSTPSSPGLFSRILNRKKLSINTPRNSRTCSMM